MCSLALVAGCASSGASSAASASADATSASAAASAAAAASTAADASQEGAASGAAASSAADASGAEAGTAQAALDPANLADGEYSVEVTLQGGSGKATVESPAKLVVIDGGIEAVIVWSSKNYDQMIVDGTDYFPVPRPGNSTFQIPVAGFDEDLPVKAETTAMSEPHMIDYTLSLDAASVQKQ